MQRKGALFAVCFFAGLLGALANSLAAWLAGNWGLTTTAGVAMTPELTKTWLYPRLVWGGVWGLAYFFVVASPRHRRRWVRKGLWISLLPSAVQLYYVFPYHTPFGTLGLGLGALTTLFVLMFNGIWGFFTGLFTRMMWGRG